MREDDLPDVPALRPLDPPPGGLARLRAALDEEPRRESRVRWAIAGAALAVIAIVWFALAARRPSARDDLVVTAPAPSAPPPVADPAIAAPAVPFYWVSSQPVAAAAADGAPARESAAPSTIPMVTFRDDP